MLDFLPQHAGQRSHSKQTAKQKPAVHIQPLQIVRRIQRSTHLSEEPSNEQYHAVPISDSKGDPTQQDHSDYIEVAEHFALFQQLSKPQPFIDDQKAEKACPQQIVSANTVPQSGKEPNNGNIQQCAQAGFCDCHPGGYRHIA